MLSKLNGSFITFSSKVLYYIDIDDPLNGIIMRPDLENVTNEVLVGVDIKAANFHYIRNNTLKFLVGVVTDGGKVNEFDS